MRTARKREPAGESLSSEYTYLQSDRISRHLNWRAAVLRCDYPFGCCASVKDNLCPISSERPCIGSKEAERFADGTLCQRPPNLRRGYHRPAGTVDNGRHKARAPHRGAAKRDDVRTLRLLLNL